MAFTALSTNARLIFDRASHALFCFHLSNNLVLCGGCGICGANFRCSFFLTPAHTLYTYTHYLLTAVNKLNGIGPFSVSPPVCQII